MNKQILRTRIIKLKNFINHINQSKDVKSCKSGIQATEGDHNIKIFNKIIVL